MTFDQAIKIILPHEGGYINDPDDAGGETNFGISKKSYPNEDIKGMSIDRAIEIYKQDYWLKNKLDNYATYLRLQIFDMIINHGKHNAVIIIQRAINMQPEVIEKLKVDGIIGNKTIELIVRSGIYIKELITIQRILFYNNIVIENPSQIKYLKGWDKRATDMLIKTL